jgi:pimeloyl-ACP methyl ester carboxylesterase
MNANLLVPGTGGVTLLDNEGNDVGWPVLMRLRGIIRGVQGKDDEELIELMGMQHRPGQLAPAKTSLKRGTSLQPGHVLRVAYNQLEDFNRFRYDWRADLRHSAGLLLDFLRERKPAGGRWNVVGHSQGGLLIVLASKMLPSASGFSEVVASATLVGAPVAGTLNAAEAMVIGDNAGSRLAPVMRRTIRTWPAIYQMLPAWAAVVEDGDGTSAPADRQLTVPGGWAGLDGIDADLLERARAVQQLFRDPFSHMEGVDVRFFFAANRQTPSRIRSLTAATTVWEPVQNDPGDSLAPYAETMRWLGTSYGPRCVRFNAPCEPHAYLLNDPTVVTQLRSRLL